MPGAAADYVTAIILLKHIQINQHLVKAIPAELATLIQAIAASVATANRGFITVLDITERMQKTLGGSSDGGVEVRDDYADVFEAFTHAKKHQGLRLRLRRALAPSPPRRAKTRSGRPCGSPAGRPRCRTHRCAPGAGGPEGERNGNYRDGLTRKRCGCGFGRSAI